MSEEFESESSRKLSIFNGTIAQLMRLDVLWKKTHEYSLAGLYSKWNMVLDCVWRELSEDADDEDEKKFWDFNVKINDHKIDDGKKYVLILKKEMFLRKLQNKQGKGTAYEDPESDW